MVEKIMLDYLTAKLSVPVYMEVPEEHDASYVVIERTGSSREDHIDSPVLAFQSYGATLYDAAALNEQVKAAVDASVSLPTIGAARFNSDYNYTDTDTKEYRYQSVYVITSLE